MLDPKEKQRGRELLKRGCALIDMSNRTKEIKEKSSIALASNKIQFTILMKSSEKKKVFAKLGKENSPKRVATIVHAVKIYFALSLHLDEVPAVFICGDGFDRGLLKHYLKNLLGNMYSEDKIHIWQTLRYTFGKKNIADKLAREVTKHGRRPSMILKESHFRNLRLI